MVKELKVGKFYHVKWGKSKRETLMQILDISEKEITFLTFAHNYMNGANKGFGTYFTPDTFNIIKKSIQEITDVKDLPIYLGWHFVSDAIIQMIKQGYLETGGLCVSADTLMKGRGAVCE
jgi:hypothetical protein